MAYEIHALAVPRGEATAAALDEIVQREEGEEGAPLDPGKEARKRSIATSMSQPGMGFEVVEHDYAELAEQRDTTEDQVRRELRHVQCQNGTLVLEVEEEHVTVKVPYSSELSHDELAEMVFETLQALHTEAKLVPYDPQLGRELDIESDHQAFLESFQQHLDEARRKGAEEPPDAGRKPPFWKRLFG